METTRKQTNYNKVVNYDTENNEITVLDYIFENDNFKGATGTKFEIWTKDYYNSILDEYYEDPQAVSEYWKDNIGVCLTYDEIMEISNDKEEIMGICGGLDTSYSKLWDYMREELGLSEDEAYVFNCIGGGRCFDKNFKGNVNPELSELIRDIES